LRRKREIVRGALDGKQIEVVKNLVERVNGQDGLNIRAPSLAVYEVDRCGCVDDEVLREQQRSHGEVFWRS